jgi:hypothetical protein
LELIQQIHLCVADLAHALLQTIVIVLLESMGTIAAIQSVLNTSWKMQVYAQEMVFVLRQTNVYAH